MNAPFTDAAATLSVVMPAYNERDNIRRVVARVLTRPEVGELIVVEDGGTDGTWEELQKLVGTDPRLRILKQPRNMGKGAALIRGFSEATRPLVIVQDADFEYDPDDYPVVIAPLLAGKADVVYGSRFMRTPGQVRNFRHEMGNKFLTFWSNVFSDIHLSDMETCYKAFRREVIQNLVLNSQRFGIEVEITAKLAGARGLRIWEVPVTYAPRWYGEGKKITWRDGIAALWHIFKFNTFFSTRRAFRRPWDEVLDRQTNKNKEQM